MSKRVNFVNIIQISNNIIILLKRRLKWGNKGKIQHYYYEIYYYVLA